MFTAAAVRPASSSASKAVTASRPRCCSFMLKIVSRIERRVPAARIPANDEPDSTSRCAARCHQTRCGIRCTSGCAPVAIDDRQTGVSDGKVETPRRYVPCCARKVSAGAAPVSTASSKTSGVSPSITTRISFLRTSVTREAAQARVPRRRAPPAPRAPPGRPPRGGSRKRGQGDGLEVADHRDERERREHHGREPDESGRPTPRSATLERPRDEGRDDRRAERAADAAGPRPLPAADRVAPPGASSGGRQRDDEQQCSPWRQQGREQPADPDPDAEREPNSVRLPHRALSLDAALPVGFEMRGCRENAFSIAPAPRPVLFFCAPPPSAPARRMESLMAHLARKERTRLRVTSVDVNEQPELAERFHVSTVPTLTLVKGKQVVERLEGRVSAPKIERMLEPHLIA